MLSKCANKECTARFKYFGIGLLFVTQADCRRAAKKNAPPELSWLCDKCSRLKHGDVPKRLPVIVGPNSRRSA